MWDHLKNLRDPDREEKWERRIYDAKELGFMMIFMIAFIEIILFTILGIMYTFGWSL